MWQSDPCDLRLRLSHSNLNLIITDSTAVNKTPQIVGTKQKLFLVPHVQTWKDYIAYDK